MSCRGARQGEDERRRSASFHFSLRDSSFALAGYGLEDGASFLLKKKPALLIQEEGEVNKAKFK